MPLNHVTPDRGVCAARAGRTHALLLAAALPVAFGLAVIWPGCHPLDSWVERTGALWLVLAVLGTVECARTWGAGWTRSLLRLLVASVIVLIIGISGPSGALDRGAQTRTMGDLRTMGTAIEAHASEHGSLPALTSVEDLVALTGKALPLVDGWGGPYAVASGEAGYCLVSHGLCGEPDVPAVPGGPSRAQYPGETPTGRWQSDLVFCDGAFVRWPEGRQTSSR